MYKTTTAMLFGSLMLRNGWDIAPKPLSHWMDDVRMLPLPPPLLDAVATFSPFPPFSLFLS